MARYLADQLSVTEQLDGSQKEALTAAVNHSDGPRLPETDQQQVTALHDAVNSYVATIPDQEPVTTNDNTGELFIGGSLLIVASLAIGTIVGKRQRKQIERYRAAHAELSEVIRSTRDWNKRQQLIVIAESANFDRHTRLGEKLQPKRGGMKKRRKLIENVQATIDAIETEEVTAA